MAGPGEAGLAIGPTTTGSVRDGQVRDEFLHGVEGSA
jgi:hypothetical protein